MEDQSDLWKVFEFTINILQALGEEATLLGLTTQAPACCRLEKWFQKVHSSRQRDTMLGFCFVLVVFLTQVVLERLTRSQSLEELALGF